MSTTSNYATISMFPREIIILIFQYLSRVDIGKAARTCKSWHKCSKDPLLRWAILRSLEVVERFVACPAGLSPQQYRIKRRKELAADGKVPFAVGQANWMINLLTEDGEVFAPVNVVSGSATLTTADLPVKDPSFIKWEIEPLPQDKQRHYYQMYWGGVVLCDMDLLYPCAWRVRLMVNIHKIEQAVKQDLPRPWEQWIIQNFAQNFYFEYSLDRMPFDYRAVHTPLERRGEELEQPEGFQEGLKLHPYQLAAVRWMKTIESETEKGFDYTTFAVWRSARSDLLIDLQNKKFVTAEAAESRRHSFRLNGGILADEMGLGKTIELCGLMLSNPAPQGFLVRKPKGLMPTKATLVFCPNHLAKQWIEELRARAPSLRAVLIATILDRRAQTVSSIREADVVVVTYNFLQNNNYNPDKKQLNEQIYRIDKLKNQMKESTSVGMKSLPFIEQFLWHRIILDEAHDAFGPQSFILQAILLRIEGRYKWYVSGTPFATGALVHLARSWLSQDPQNPIEFASSDPVEKHYQLWIECDLMLNNLYWRNTKASVKADWSIPNLKYQTLMLDFQPIEKVHYDDISFQYVGNEGMLLRVCNGEMLSGRALNVLINEFKVQLPERIAGCKMRITEFSNLLEGNLHPEYNASYEADMERCQKSLAHYEKLVLRVNSLSHWVPSAAEPAESTKKSKRAAEVEEKEAEEEEQQEEEPAPKGRGKKASGKKTPAKKAKKEEAVTPAPAAPKGRGSKRLKKEEPEEKKEPEEEQEVPPTQPRIKIRGRAVPPRKAAAKLAQPATPAALFLATTIDHDTGETKPLDALVQQLGTKLANVLSWLRDLLKNDSNARVILFSAFSAYLNRVQTHLDIMRIPTVHVEGNVFQKSKALREFKQDDEVRVILLCSERAAAGTNLMEASHVVLLDPMTGTKEQALAAESQAIGRAYRQGQKGQVTVVRFVIRNTIDHELYSRNTESKEEKDLKRMATGRSQLVRTSSLAVMLADRSKSSGLTRAGSVTKLVENNPTLQ